LNNRALCFASSSRNFNKLKAFPRGKNGGCPMSNDTDAEQRIRERAFEIWIEEGQPEGKHKEHWERARLEVEKFREPSGGPSTAS